MVKLIDYGDFTLNGLVQLYEGGAALRDEIASKSAAQGAQILEQAKKICELTGKVASLSIENGLLRARRDDLNRQINTLASPHLTVGVDVALKGDDNCILVTRMPKNAEEWMPHIVNIETALKFRNSR